MVDVSNAIVSPGRAVVCPIYDAMIWRAVDLLEIGTPLDAADMLTTAAETLRSFDHPREATRVARWARELLEV
jgi:hypothetical protein